MDEDLIATVRVVRVVFRVIVKFYSSFKRVFKGSLVRQIASLLPPQPAPRIHINVPLCSTPYESFYEDNYLPSPHRESSNTTYFGSILSPRISSTPETQRLKIQHLEKQLLELKQQVAKIILQIPTSDYDSHHSSVNTWLTNQSSPFPANHQVLQPPVSSSQFCQQNEPPLPPLPPPPPPPPLPPQNFLTPKPRHLVLCTPSKQSGASNNADLKKSPASLLSDVIQQITRERPNLKPVKRSPGGNPLKTPKREIDDPSDILSKVLRQRFSALHSESITDTCDNNSSISSIHSQIFSCPSSPASAI